MQLGQSGAIDSKARETELPMNHLRDFLSVFVVCLASTLGFTQTAQSGEKQPKLGLVLEGGGALGLAHIGVIQYLEEHRIPVKYIAGQRCIPNNKTAARIQPCVLRDIADNGRDIRELTSRPGLHLLPHGFEIPLHPINSDRNAVDQRKRLRVFGEHWCERTWDNVSSERFRAFSQSPKGLEYGDHCQGLTTATPVARKWLTFLVATVMP